ncbi:MAG TPA: YbjQ family protein [Capsulimonadaceae bacterium]
MVTTTTNDIDGYAVTQYLGVVRGIVVRSPNIAQGFIGGINQIFGGNISAYADVCETARAEAYELMRQHAKAMGADGIIAVRYDATEFMQGATEVLCYGTAVRLAPRSAS